MVPCHRTCHPVSLCNPSHTFRSSSDEKTLSCARRKLRGFGHRSFSVQAALVWNNLLPHFRHSSFLSQFKTSLKSFLYTSAFSELPWSPGRLLFLFILFSWTTVVRVADLSVKGRVSDGRQDGVREGEGRERKGKREEGRWEGGGKEGSGQESLGERGRERREGEGGKEGGNGEREREGERVF